MSRYLRYEDGEDGQVGEQGREWQPAPTDIKAVNTNTD